MANWRKARYSTGILLVFSTILLYGCAGGQTKEQLISPLYMLTASGFKPWTVNMETPKRQALLNALPKGKIVTYERNGEVYHVYADENSSTLYVGDQAAYQKYLSLARGKKICERVNGTNPQGFWNCMEESQKADAGQWVK
jgi:hypothetical protein